MLLLWVTGTCRSPETGLGIELEVLMKELKFFCKKENKKNI
nr:MAG TPA: putative translation initiation factor 2 domain protein [Caudoviricetes sp.]